MVSTVDRARSAGAVVCALLCNLACEETPPAARPEGLRVVSVSWTSVELAWQAIQDGHGFEVAVLQPGDDWIVLSPALAAADVQEPIQGLTAGTRYAFRVRAVGEYKGLESEWSDEVVVRTLSLPSLTVKRVSSGTSPFADGEQNVQAIGAWVDADRDGVFDRAGAPGDGVDAVYPRWGDASCRAREGGRFAPGANVLVAADVEHLVDPSQHQFLALHLRVENGSVTGAALFGGDDTRVQREAMPAAIDLAYLAMPTAAMPGRLTGTLTATLAATCNVPAARVSLSVDVPLELE